MEYKHSENSQKPKTSLPDSALLKNIRQIGTHSIGYRLYIEDCVLSYLKHEMKKDEGHVIALVGRETTIENETCMFIDGALRVEDIYASGRDLSFGQKAFSKLYEEMNSFFSSSSLIGWYVPMYEMIRTYGAALGEKSRLFMIEDPTGQDELFYIKEQGRIRKLSGYYIYYDKNIPMQNYLVNQREELEDEVLTEEPHSIREQQKTKDSKIYEKGKNKASEIVKTIKKADKENEPAKWTPFLYAASTVLAIVVLVVGITMMSNYEKMHDMQSSLQTIASQVSDTLSSETKKIETESSPLPSVVDTTSPQTEPVATMATAGAATEGVKATSMPKSSSSQMTANKVDVVEYYVVQDGDTLAAISMKLYDSVNMVEEICSINSIENQDSLYIGQKLYLPE